jgi:type IV pilus assembly protein PilM
VLGVNLKKWFANKAGPIGADFGADSIKLVQLQPENGESRILASARRDIPADVAGDPDRRIQFIGEALRDMLGSGIFKSKRVVTAVPAEQFFVQHVRMARMSEDDLVKALPWEAQGHLPFPARDAVLRHLISTDLHVDGEAKSEVILMAAPKPAVERHLNALVRAKLEVEAVLVPPLAMIEAFRFLFTRANEREMTTCFVDVGASHTAAVITHSTRVVFVKQMGIGGHAIDSAIATRLDCSRQEANRLRREAAEQACDEPVQAPPGRDGATPPPANLRQMARDNGGGVAVAAEAAAATDGGAMKLTDDRRHAVGQVCHEQIDQLSRELSYCVRYYQSLFPDRPIDRLVFLGGEAHSRLICQQIARTLRMPAMLGDPMLRMHQSHEGRDCGDLSPPTPAPEWSIAFGCALTESTDSV